MKCPFGLLVTKVTALAVPESVSPQVTEKEVDKRDTS